MTDDLEPRPDPPPWRLRRPRLRAAVGTPRPGGPAPPSDGVAPEEVVPFNRIRSRASAALVESKTGSAHAWCALPADFAAVEAARSTARDSFRSEEGFSLTFLPFVARAVAGALLEFPLLNSTVAAVPGSGTGGLVVHDEVNLGFAVDLDHQGLVVPVVRDAGRLPVTSIARAVHDLATRARAKRLQPDEVAGVTFTITNPGAAGTWMSIPIIHRPAVAILSTDGVRRRVVARDGALAIRPVGYLGLSYDRSVIGPTYAAGFLTRVAELLARRDWSDEV
ncbi:MAG: 2-oxo acid dehydrogenase subunit E2 [Acidimicrobiia bacterium]|nr:2-oxo acid dehydrogenase subunit E2 [Acidimicrobiia bacterium]